MRKTILCFGDSNTYGANPVNDTRYPEKERWPGVLRAELGQGWQVLEQGLPGRTTVFDDPVDEGLSGLAYLRPCMLSCAPVYQLVIMLGTNDAKERFSANPCLIAKGMARLVQKALHTPAWQDIPRILVLAPPPVHPSYLQKKCGASLGPGCDEKTAALATYYRQLSDELGVDFLNTGKFAAVSPADGVHLTKDAHQSIGHKVAAHIQQSASKNATIVNLP